MTDRNEQRVVYETDWDAETEPNSTHAVVSTVASVEGSDATELPPLHEAIDSDALNRLVSPTGDSGAELIVFRYCGYEVLIDDAGVRLRAPTGQS